MRPSKATPMIKQYLSIKKKYPDTVLFFRMGDFYEMFFEDAEIASRTLEITLTSRNKNVENPIPMCGVPYRSVKGYIAGMLDKGFKVAICDQIETATAAKGLVKRDVVRVITPGMIIEDELLDAGSNNYILSMSGNGGFYGLSYLDISTATFRLTQSKDSKSLIDEALRIAPREILLMQSDGDDPVFKSLTSILPKNTVTYIDDKHFKYTPSRERLLALFKTLSLEGFGCEGLKAAVGSAGALVYYVGETQKQLIEHIGGIETYFLNNHLTLDDTTFRNLEIIEGIKSGNRSGTLVDILDKTVTAMGGRLFKQWLKYPLMDVSEIEIRLDAVQEAVKNHQASRVVRETLKSVYDLERLNSKIAMGHATARDLVALKQSLFKLPAIRKQLSNFETSLFKLTDNIEELGWLSKKIDDAIRENCPPTIHEGGMIRQGYSNVLDELIQVSREGKNWLAILESEQKKATGINSLKVRYNKVFGYYIEISKIHHKSVPDHYIRKQTLVNAERYITEELKDFEAKVLGAEDQRVKLEYELFHEISKLVINQNYQIQKTARFLAQLDCFLALARVADQNGYVRPDINTDGLISIEAGRHPVVEKMISGERFVPNSITLDDVENQVLIITGPNMAGKSTVLRQVALLVFMAHLGSFIPARKASISITDRIFSRVGALDNLSSGQSTFMVEMEETANILNSATHRSLVILDEIGRGTSTYDGFSIAWAVADYLHDMKNRGVKTLFATHYHELTELEKIKPKIKNYNIAVKEWNDEIIFLRKLIKGDTNRSYGIQVARLAGIPEKVISDAKKILFEIETGVHDVCGLSLLRKGSNKTAKKHIQLSLFQQPGDIVMERLQRVEIAELSPLEALNYLNDLKETAIKSLQD